MRDRRIDDRCGCWAARMGFRFKMQIFALLHPAGLVPGPWGRHGFAADAQVKKVHDSRRSVGCGGHKSDQCGAAPPTSISDAAFSHCPDRSTNRQFFIS